MYRTFSSGVSLLLLASTMLPAQELPNPRVIDAEARRLMASQDVKGMALAVIDDALQFVLEEGLGLDVNAEMQRRVFDRFGMPNTSMQWRPDFAENLADGYGMDGSYEPHDERSNVSAAGSMDTTIEDQARMWARIVRGDGLSEESRAELVRPHLEISSARQFPTLVHSADPRAAQINLAAGLGLVTAGEAEDKTWFKGGHDPWTGNMVVCREERQRCIVLLANSVRAELIYPQLVEFVLSDIAVPWWWEYSHE